MSRTRHANHRADTAGSRLAVSSRTLSFVRWLHRRGVSRRKLRHTWLHRLLGDRLFTKDLWAFRRDSVARGWLIGALVAATPFMGVQLLMGLPLALLSRANVLTVMVLVFMTNPATAIFFYPLAFLLGCNVLGLDPADLQWNETTVWGLGGPLMLGCALAGALIGLTGFLLIRVLWREKQKPSGGWVPTQTSGA